MYTDLLLCVYWSIIDHFVERSLQIAQCKSFTRVNNFVFVLSVVFIVPRSSDKAKHVLGTSIFLNVLFRSGLSPWQMMREQTWNENWPKMFWIKLKTSISNCLVVKITGSYLIELTIGPVTGRTTHAQAIAGNYTHYPEIQTLSRNYE